MCAGKSGGAPSQDRSPGTIEFSAKRGKGLDGGGLPLSREATKVRSMGMI